MDSICVATFLLSIGNPYIADRIVLTEFSRSNAYVHREISKANQFPMNKPSSDVYMIKSDTQKPGTSYAIYCSQKLDGKIIMDGLLNQLKPFTIDGPSKDQRRINPENPCLMQLSKRAVERNYDFILTSEIKKDNSCSGKNLMELALHRYITIQNYYFSRRKELLDKKIQIYFDLPIEIRIGSEQVYFAGKQVNNKTEDEILMWYMGYLHVFRRRINSRKWYVSTSLTSLDYNGYQISEFFWRNSSPYKRFIKSWEFLETLVDKRIHYPGLTETELDIERQRKIFHERIERLRLDNLQPSHVHGIIPSFFWYGNCNNMYFPTF